MTMVSNPHFMKLLAWQPERIKATDRLEAIAFYENRRATIMAMIKHTEAIAQHLTNSAEQHPSQSSTLTSLGESMQRMAELRYMVLAVGEYTIIQALANSNEIVESVDLERIKSACSHLLDIESNLSEKDQQRYVQIAKDYNNEIANNPDAFSALVILRSHREAIRALGRRGKIKTESEFNAIKSLAIKLNAETNGLTEKYDPRLHKTISKLQNITWEKGHARKPVSIEQKQAFKVQQVFKSFFSTNAGRFFCPDPWKATGTTFQSTGDPREGMLVTAAILEYHAGLKNN